MVLPRRGLGYLMRWRGSSNFRVGAGPMQTRRRTCLCSFRTGESGSVLPLAGRQIGNETGIVLRSRGHLDHGDAHFGRKELLGIGTLVDVTTSAAVILHHEVHLLDALGPDDRIVLPK